MMRGAGLARTPVGAPAAHFIGVAEADGYTSGATFNLPPGTVAGDLVVAMSAAVSVADFVGTIILGFGGSGYKFNLCRYVVTSGDVSAGHITTSSGSGATTLMGFYHGPTTATVPTDGFNDNTTSSPVICPGLTKNAAAQVIAYFVGAPNNPTLGANPGTLRAITADGRVGLADFDPASLYTNGTAESWAYTSLSNILMPAFDLH